MSKEYNLVTSRINILYFGFYLVQDVLQIQGSIFRPSFNAREELNLTRKNPTFEEILEHKKKKYGLTDDEAYQDIIRSSTTTNKKYDKISGVDQ